MSQFNISVKLDASTTGGDSFKKINKDLQALTSTATKANSGFEDLGSSAGEATEAISNFGSVSATAGAESAASFTSMFGAMALANVASQALLGGMRALQNAIAAVVSEGLKMNEFLETANLGIATSIFAQYNLRGAQGEVLQGQEAYNAALQLGQEQMRQLRIAGLETAATTQELAESFQSAMAVGAGQKITDLNKIRQLTVDVTNAATALGVAQAEVPTAIRAIITGQEVEANTLARILVGSGEQVRLWQQQGKLLDELNKRLKPFSEGVRQAANSWAVVKSNIEESFQVFSGEVTSGLFEELKKSASQALAGVFDTKNLGISKQFSALTDSFKSVFDGIGVVIADAISGAVELAKWANGFLTENASYIDEWRQGFREVWVAVREVFKVVFDLGKSIFGINKATGEWAIVAATLSLTLKGVALLIAGMVDGVRTIGSLFIWVGGLITDIILKPIGASLVQMGQALNLIKKGWGDGLISVGKTLDQVGGKVRGFAADLFDPIAEGNGAVQKVLKSFKDTGTAADDAGKKIKKAGDALVDSAKNPQKKTAGTGAQNAIAKAEADAAIAQAKDRLQREQTQLDYALSQQLISIKDYYAKRQAAQLEAIQADEKAKLRELAAIQAAMPKSKDDELNKQAQTIKLQSELNLLKEKEGDIITENTRKEQEATRVLTQKVLEIRAQLEQATGSSTFETLATQVAEKFRVVRQQFVTEFGADSSQVDLVDKLVDVELAKANFARLKTEYDNTLEAMRLKEDEVALARESGRITSMEAASQINAIRQEEVDKLTELVAKLDEYANKVKDPAVVNAAKAIAINTQGLVQPINELSKAIKDGLEDNLAALFEDLATGAKSGEDAVKSFGRAVLATFARIASQRLAEQAMQWITNLPIFRAEGGLIKGPGTGTSDSVPVMASNGEYIIKASRVRQLGTGFLDLLNGTPGTGRKLAYADGGLIGPQVVTGNPTINSKTSIVNVLDPSLMAQYLQSPGGEKAILNVIKANPNLIRRLS